MQIRRRTNRFKGSYVTPRFGRFVNSCPRWDSLRAKISAEKYSNCRVNFALACLSACPSIGDRYKPSLKYVHTRAYGRRLHADSRERCSFWKLLQVRDTGCPRRGNAVRNGALSLVERSQRHLPGNRLRHDFRHRGIDLPRSSTAVTVRPIRARSVPPVCFTAFPSCCTHKTNPSSVSWGRANARGEDEECRTHSRGTASTSDA